MPMILFNQLFLLHTLRAAFKGFDDHRSNDLRKLLKIDGPRHDWTTDTGTGFIGGERSRVPASLSIAFLATKQHVAHANRTYI